MTDTDPPPTDPAPLDLRGRVLELARVELAAHVHESPSHSNTGPRVAQYLAGCVRGGHLLGLTAAEWCAAFASWCVWAAWLQQNQDPEKTDVEHFLAWPQDGTRAIGYRAAVAELVTDAKATGAWHDVAELSADCRPELGDLLVMARVGEDPRHGGHGHVGIIEEALPGGWQIISGNDGDSVRASARSRSPRDPEPVVGWISLG